MWSYLFVVMLQTGSKSSRKQKETHTMSNAQMNEVAGSVYIVETLWRHREPKRQPTLDKLTFVVFASSDELAQTMVLGCTQGDMETQGRCLDSIGSRQLTSERSSHNVFFVPPFSVIAPRAVRRPPSRHVLPE